MLLIQIIQFTLLGASVLFSGLVLLGQKKSAIRESVEQLDDRTLGSANLKLSVLVHEIDFCDRTTVLSIRSEKIPDVAGMSNPGNIDDLTKDVEAEVDKVDGVDNTRLDQITSTTGYADSSTIEEEHMELLVTCDSIDQGEVRRIADSVLSKIRAGERASRS